MKYQIPKKPNPTKKEDDGQSIAKSLLGPVLEITDDLLVLSQYWYPILSIHLPDAQMLEFL